MSNHKKPRRPIDLTGVTHFHAVEEITDILCNRTQNTARNFYQTQVAYFLGKLAANMHAIIDTKDRGLIPVNVYALALANSGFGKNYSISIIENDLMKPFQNRMVNSTFLKAAEASLWKIANRRSAISGKGQQEEFDRVEAEFNRDGPYPYTFDSATAPAVKQLHHKLAMATAGCISLQVDEIGSNLVSSTEVLNLFLELFDQGQIKQKLTKNTEENKRSRDIIGGVPTCMLLFGAPSKLLDGGQTEDSFYSFLEIGYARRCIFGFGSAATRSSNNLPPIEIYKRLIDPTNKQMANKWSKHFHDLGDPGFLNWKIELPDDIAVQLLSYRIECEKVADELPEYAEIQKAEINHRYFKALKIAGAYAFVDQSAQITEDHLLSAILLVEESGDAFSQILTREKPYVKLAKYIADIDGEVTHADLVEALPFYKQNNASRVELITLASAWGYKNNILIKKTFNDGIEFFTGESLQPTSMDEVQVSYSDHWAYNYETERVPFTSLDQLTQVQGYHWANHAFQNGHRSDEKTIPGFNLLVFDIDGTCPLGTAAELLKDYAFHIYTTKSHTDESHRFRMVLPINYLLELDSDDYLEFMNSVMAWLPFKVDHSSNQRNKKWESCNGSYGYNDGRMVDALPHIPKTSRNHHYKKENKPLQNLNNLERWFASQMMEGNRNNSMLRYALALVDSGMSQVQVRKHVHEFNNKLANRLPPGELDSTILTTVSKKYNKTS